jgi:hypothetical protein
VRQQILDDIRQHWAVGLRPEQLVLQAAGLLQDSGAEIFGPDLLSGSRQRKMCTYLSDILREACNSVECGGSYGTLRVRLNRTAEQKARALKRQQSRSRRRCQYYDEPTFADKRKFISRWLPNSKTDHWKTHVAALTICIWVARQYIYMVRREHNRPSMTATTWSQTFYRNSESYVKQSKHTIEAMTSQR